MTLDAWDIALYAGALAILFLTPGPVWVGLIARSLSGGFHAAWPLALGNRVFFIYVARPTITQGVSMRGRQPTLTLTLTCAPEFEFGIRILFFCFRLIYKFKPQRNTDGQNGKR